MDTDKRFCPTCGHVGEPARETPGSIWIEVVLWLCFIVPGLIYSIWRLNRRHDVCAKCGAATLLPVDSPVAMSMSKSLGIPPETLAPRTKDRPPRDSPTARALGAMVGRMIGRR